jgi:WD40 repeat protein
MVGALALPIGTLAGGSAPANRPAAVDLHGNPLPAGALARLGTGSFYHEYGDYVGYSGNGKILASAGEGVIRLWDALTGRDLGQFPGNRFFALSQDGTRLASQALREPRSLLFIWDTSSGKAHHRVSALQGVVRALAFSPDGKLLATGGEGPLLLWDTATGKKVRLLAENGDYFSALAFSPDGKTLFSGEHRRTGKEALTRIWEVASGKERQGYSGQAFVALSADGQVMAAAGEKGFVLHLVNVRSGEIQHTFKNLPGEGPPRDISSACFAPDGKILATVRCVDSAIRLWEIPSGRAVRTIPLRAHAYSVAFSADGKTLAVGLTWGAFEDNRIRLFDPATGEEKILPPGRMDAIYNIRFLPGGKGLASISADKSFRLWQPRSGKTLRSVALARVPRAIAPDGSQVAVSGQADPMGLGSWVPVREETLELCDTSNGKARHQLKHEGTVMRAAWAPDGSTIAVSTEEAQVYLWDTATGKLRRRWAAPAGWSLVFSPDGKTLATGDGDCTVQLWEAVSGRLIRRFGKPLERDRPHRLVIAGTTSIAFSPNGKTVAAAVTSENTIYVWDVASGKEVCQCKGHPIGQNHGWVYALAFSPDGKTLFSGSQDRTVRLWEVATGNERARLEGHRGAIHTLALSPEGTHLASGSKDCTILIWNLASLPR